MRYFIFEFLLPVTNLFQSERGSFALIQQGWIKSGAEAAGAGAATLLALALAFFRSPGIIF